MGMLDMGDRGGGASLNIVEVQGMGYREWGIGDRGGTEGRGGSDLKIPPVISSKMYLLSQLLSRMFQIPQSPPTSSKSPNFPQPYVETFRSLLHAANGSPNIFPFSCVLN